MATSLDKGKYYKITQTQDYGIFVMAEGIDAANGDPSSKVKPQIFVHDSLGREMCIDFDHSLKDWTEITKEEFDELAGR